MANSLIPYSFIPGTKAMASEVNANFIALANAVDEAKTFTTTSIEQFNTELEERLDESLDEKLEVGLSNCTNISNCILELPERINYEINSAGRIILKAGSEVYVSTNGTFEAVTLSSDTAEGAGGLWTPDHSRSLFVVYIPASNTVINADFDHTFAQSIAPTSFLSNRALWFDTENNIVKFTDDSGATWQICSLPILAGRPGATNVGWRGYVDNVFNGIGFINQLTFVLPGIKVLFADGRNSDGTLKNKEVTSNIVQVMKLANQTSSLGQLKVKDDSLALYGYGVTNYFEQETPPGGFGTYAIWYNTLENQVYETGDGGATWSKTYNIVLSKLIKNSLNGAISGVSTPYALKIADINDVLKRIAMPVAKAENGYTKLPNGVIIQWGNIPATSASSLTVTLPAAFSTTNYAVVCQMGYTNVSDHRYINTQQIIARTTSNFTMYKGTSESSNTYWLAIGY